MPRLLYNNVLSIQATCQSRSSLSQKDRWQLNSLSHNTSPPIWLVPHFWSFTIYDVSGRFITPTYTLWSLLNLSLSSLSLSLSLCLFPPPSPSLSLSLPPSFLHPFLFFFLLSLLSLLFLLSLSGTRCIHTPSSVTPTQSHQPSFCHRWVHRLMVPIMALLSTSLASQLLPITLNKQLICSWSPTTQNSSENVLLLRVVTNQLPYNMELPYMVCVHPIHPGSLV